MMSSTYTRGRRALHDGDAAGDHAGGRSSRKISGARLLRWCAQPLLIALLSTVALAQGGRGSDNILYPQPILPSYVGIDGGYAWWNAKASFGVSDQTLPCALFGDGSGSGATFGARLLHNVTPWLILSPRIRWESRASTFVTPLDDEPIRDVGGTTGTLHQEAQVDATLGALSADLLIGFRSPKLGLYGVLGPSVGLATGGTYDYKERVLGPAGYVYGDNGASEHTLRSGGSFDRYQKITISARAGIGYILDVGDFAINPEVLYSLPITSTLDAPDELKQSGVMAMLGILYYIGE